MKYIINIILLTLVVLLSGCGSITYHGKIYKNTGHVRAKYLNNVEVESDKIKIGLSNDKIYNEKIFGAHNLNKEKYVEYQIEDKNSKHKPEGFYSKTYSMSANLKKELKKLNKYANKNNNDEAKTKIWSELIYMRSFDPIDINNKYKSLGYDCKLRRYEIKFKIYAKNKDKLLFANTYEEIADELYRDSILKLDRKDPCYRAVGPIPTPLYEITTGMVRTIAKQAIYDIVGTKKKFRVNLLENIDVEVDAQDKKRFKSSTWYIAKNTQKTLSFIKKYLEDLDKKTNNKSYAVKYNLGVINEILRYDNKSIKYYEDSLKIAKNKNSKDIKLISDALSRAKKYE